MNKFARLIFVFMFSLAFPTLGQTRQIGQAKQESCDGALDVVPSKSVTFQRKRRPANAPQTQATSTHPIPRKKTGK
jgi:hypothetical protein